MNLDQFEKYCDRLLREAGDIRISKGREYSGDADRFANFNRMREALGVSREQVCMVYMAKHWDSILTYIRTNENGSEPIKGRVIDLINYLLLLHGMIEERARFPKTDSLGDPLFLGRENTIGLDFYSALRRDPSVEDLDKVCAEKELASQTGQGVAAQSGYKIFDGCTMRTFCVLRDGHKSKCADYDGNVI